MCTRYIWHQLRFVSDIAIFVLKRDVKLQLTNSGCGLSGLANPSPITPPLSHTLQCHWLGLICSLSATVLLSEGKLLPLHWRSDTHTINCSRTTQHFFSAIRWCSIWLYHTEPFHLQLLNFSALCIPYKPTKFCHYANQQIYVTASLCIVLFICFTLNTNILNNPYNNCFIVSDAFSVDSPKIRNSNPLSSRSFPSQLLQGNLKILYFKASLIT